MQVGERRDIELEELPGTFVAGERSGERIGVPHRFRVQPPEKRLRVMRVPRRERLSHDVDVVLGRHGDLLQRRSRAIGSDDGGTLALGSAKVNWRYAVAMPLRHETYTHGHAPAVVRQHAQRTAEEAAAFLLPSLRPGMRLLDVGCGPGSITRGLAERVAPGEVIGLDLSKDTLEDARP